MESFRIFLDTDVLINVEAYTPEEFLEKYFPNIFERIKNELGI